MSKILKLLLVALVALGIFAGCEKKSAADRVSIPEKPSIVEEIKKRGVLRVAVFTDKPPFGYIDASGKYQGYDVYFAKRLAKELLGDESKVEFVPVEAAARVEIVESGRVDIVLANFTVTKERAQKVLFANPYFKTALGVVSPDGAPITDIKQLEGKKLVVNKGTTADIYFATKHPEIELLKYDQNTEAFQALRDGRGVALAHDNALLFAWAISNPGFSVAIGSIGDPDPIAPAVKQSDVDLKDWINETFVKLGRENFALEAYEATLRPVYGDTVKPEDLIVEGGVL